MAMKLSSLDELLKATKLTASGRLQEATTLIQQALQPEAAARTAPEWMKPGSSSEQGLSKHGPVIEGVAERIGEAPASEATAKVNGKPGGKSGPGQFLSATFSNAAGSRAYRLYVPGNYTGSSQNQPVPLIVMLHGCTQSPEDFAAGTRINEFAEAQGFLVAYPAQTQAANSSKCWNWFNAGEQRRDQGEPSLIAGITRDVMARYAVDPRRVYVAGLSAGGAAAAIMGTAYPDLFAAIGVHSGLACGAATDVMSAFSAMHQGHGGAARPAGAVPVPVIVFHGDQDRTVNLRNGDAVIAQMMPANAGTQQATEGRVPGGHAYNRIRYMDANGKTMLEQWVIHGAGHAWAGGSEAGSFTDPKGPDATREMVRFFFEHPRA
jgi:poly(hydroxyalkanoate) depolymerase family esterase